MLVCSMNVLSLRPTTSVIVDCFKIIRCSTKWFAREAGIPLVKVIALNTFLDSKATEIFSRKYKCYPEKIYRIWLLPPRI